MMTACCASASRSRSGRRRRAPPAGVQDAGDLEPRARVRAPTAPATTTTPRRRCGRPLAEKVCATTTGRRSCSARASSTTATTAAAREAFERARQGARRAAGRDRAVADRRLSLDGGRSRRRRPRPTRAWSRRRRRTDAATSRWRGSDRRAGRRAQSGRARRSSSWRSSATSRRTRWPTRRCAGPARPPSREGDDGDSAAAPRRRRNLSVPDRLKRAESLTKDRHWDEALASSAKLPASCRPTLAAERDYQIGMTKFHMRRDYAKAGELLLAAAPQLSGDKAASAAFHGARALSRVDRDDEAIAGYHKVIAEFPHSRYAAEAQYLAGWLDYNRGRFSESLPGLQATLDHFGEQRLRRRRRLVPGLRALPARRRRRRRSAALERYAKHAGHRHHRRRARRRESPTGARASATRSGPRSEGRGARRVPRAGPPRRRCRSTASSARGAPERGGPGRSRWRCPAKKTRRARAPGKRGRAIRSWRAPSSCSTPAWTSRRAGRSSATRRAILQRAGGEKAAGVAAGASTAAPSDFHRAYHLVESHDAGALAAEPTPRGARVFWEAAYPARLRAARREATARRPATPSCYLYAIMRKESGFYPHDVSYADARGLLQMIPPTSARVAERARAGVLPRPALRPRDQHPPRRASTSARSTGSSAARCRWRPAPTTPGPRAMARWCDAARAAPHRRVRRADRLRADARVRQARHQPLRPLPLSLRPRRRTRSRSPSTPRSAPTARITNPRRAIRPASIPARLL